jgi:hypothetical protein
MSTLLEQASLIMIPSGYKEDVVYSVIPENGSGDLSFTRASNGTRINSSGLVEVCPWNLANDSNGFLALSAITKTTGQVSPIDSTTGNLLTATGSGEHYSGTASLTVVVGNSYTYSVYGKFVQGVQLALRTVFSNGDEDISTIWNLSTGALVANAGNHTNPTITAVGNGYYRCSITYTPSAVPAFPLLFRLQMAVGGALSFTASSGDGFLAYGAQINIGSTAKPYFPTTDRLNVPRLTYQNGGGGCPSLLLEKQSTNINTYSEDFSNVAYAKENATITTNQTTSPDGTQNADKLTDDSVNNFHIVYPNTLSITASRITASVYLKNNDIQFCAFQLATSIGGTYDTRFTFIADLVNGTITDTEQNGTPNATYSIQSVGNGWYRLNLTCDHSGGQVASVVGGSNSGTPSSFAAALPVYSGTGKSLFLWGMQIENSSYPTSYINTTSASATRVADACFKTGISSLIGQTEGTLFVDVAEESPNEDGRYMFISDASFTNRIVIYQASGSINVYCSAGGGFNLTYSPPAGRLKIAFIYKSNDYALWVNGVVRTATVVSAVPSGLNAMGISSNEGSIGTPQPLDTSVNQAILFPTRLTNAELASLTTL